MGDVMASTPPNVFGFLSAPDRNATLFAISKALLSIRQTGVTYKAIARALDVSDDTIANAVSENSLLSTDAVLRLCYFFGDHAAPVRDLILPPAEPQTLDEKIVSIQRQLDGLRGMAA